MKTKVFFHTRDKANSNWTNAILTFYQLPSVGEFVFHGSETHRVESVIQIPEEEDSEYIAEVFAVRVPDSDVYEEMDYQYRVKKE
ncbi:hypothetical protein AM500_12785 [Bacillus sp. FJAT-18017]|uniref:hypothetical protein n=1 Tax=Bacillus sp. FJAT-18017 TaxID=1705566 RepID=UPI0006B03F21|nr:hypothetical protein [Bacillus sp. FJAT-18017]ALC90563.1 hypothetical protein AM500_12785 [Bacillus sp. FJAT-18017]